MWLRSVGRADFRLVALHWAAILLTYCPDLLQFLLGQSQITLGQILHCVIKPVLLVLGLGLQHTTLQNVAEEFVPGLVKRIGAIVLTVGAVVFSHALRSNGYLLSGVTAKCTNGQRSGQDIRATVARNMQTFQWLH